MTEYDNLFKILTIGDSGVGKSSLLLKYVDDEFNEQYIASIGVDFKTKNIEVNEKRVKLQIWDTAVQERFRTIAPAYYRGAHAIILCYDITNKVSFDNVKLWLAEVDRYAPENVLKVLCDCKTDLASAPSPRVISVDQGKELANELGMLFLETSSKENIGINDLFNETTKALLNQIEVNNERDDEDGDDVIEKEDDGNDGK